MLNPNSHADDGATGHGAIQEIKVAPCRQPDKEIIVKIAGLGDNAVIIGKGTFGVVYSAHLVDTEEKVAVKRVLWDSRFKSRELPILRKLDHCNVVALKFFYGTKDGDKHYQYLIFEHMPETAGALIDEYTYKALSQVPPVLVRVYVYQLFRALAYIHSMGICHRDIKPQNILVDSRSGVLKLCDFGSAKKLTADEPNASYICSRDYRAPELLLGASNYTYSIDMWAAGCVLAEFLLSRRIFSGRNGLDILKAIAKVLGTPSREQIHEMNPQYTNFNFPTVPVQSLRKVFRTAIPDEAVDLVGRILEYVPKTRIEPLQACTHPFFNELRAPGTRLPNGKPLPPLFNFSPHELSIYPTLTSALIPSHAA